MMRRYIVETPAGDEVTVQLSDEDAKQRGLKPAKKAAAKQEPAKRSTAEKRADVANKSFGGRTS
jgi:hypothetical protein